MQPYQGLQTAPCVCESVLAPTGDEPETETTTIMVAESDDSTVVGEEGGDESKRAKTRKAAAAKPRRKLPAPYRISLDGGRCLVELPRGYKPARWYREGKRLYYSTLWYQERLMPTERSGNWKERSFRNDEGELDRQSWRAWRNGLAKLEATPKFLPAARPDPTEQRWYTTELDAPAMEARANWNFPQNWPALEVQPQPEFVQVHDRDQDVWTKAIPDPEWLYVQLPYHYEVWEPETGEFHRRTHKADKAWGLVDFGMWVPKAILRPISLEQAQVLCNLLDAEMARLDAIDAEATTR